ncbi:hypothetical protein HPB49_011178 [Dermacentor silvarum]|uniref:Uncharacterized protein n=1 Tax=Dermacentor silvarum TaxID=543639 RepID=A0ACB8CKU2_DERSI|nr:hypothetical protein HPB49_011178 [Dermacentor silvarum]
MGDQKHRFLILGGTGFVGRHLVDHLLKSDVASKIRVVDKVPPQMAWLNSAHKELYENPTVEFKSANLINPASCKAAFEDPEGPYDFVINLAAETKINLPDCKPAQEHFPLEPWTVTAQLKLAVEEDLQEMKDLDYVILRPAIVYGVADKHGIVPRILVGAVYKHLKETMKLLWTKDLKMDTVHVLDLCRAIWHVCLHGKSGDVYNVVDQGHTTQGKVTEIISERFSISHSYWGTAASLIAKTDMESTVEQVNEKHLSPWAEACLKDNITNTPLSPYLCQIVEDYVEMGLFPRSLLR